MVAHAASRNAGSRRTAHFRLHVGYDRQQLETSTGCGGYAMGWLGSEGAGGQPGKAIAVGAEAYATARRRLAWLVGAILAAMWLFVGGALLASRDSEIDHGRELLATVGSVLEERVTGAIREPLRMLDFIAARVAEGGPAADEMERLAIAIRWIEEIDSVVVVDSRGDTVASVPPTRQNFADRPWFRAPAAGAPLHAGRVVNSRLSHKDVATLSRRLAHADGSLAGVVAVGIPARLLQGLYASLDLPELVVRISGADGDMAVEPHGTPESAAVAAALRAAVAASRSGMIEADDERGRQMVWYRRLDEVPVVISAALPMDRVISGWVRDITRDLVLLVGASAVILALGRGVLLALRREHEAAQELAATAVALEAARATADRAEREKSRFMAAVSHDLYQPLKACLVMLEAAEGETDEERLRCLAAKARRAAELESELLDQLAQHSLLEQGEVQPSRQDVPVWEVLEPLLDVFAAAADRKGIRLTGIPSSAVIRSDPALLRRIVMNLVNNAVRYTDRGAVVLGCRRRDAELWIEVHDQGPGIAPEMLKDMFQRHHRDHYHDHSLALGLGLGLRVTDGLARLLGHRIEVLSTVGRGSCFRVRVPLSDEYRAFAAAGCLSALS